ncbi:MAG: vitamin K epoxide reductase [Chloroflexi bacterium]|nr:MAG: vitamin K epoxide reductase [Chloroflexota bacterium]
MKDQSSLLAMRNYTLPQIRMKSITILILAFLLASSIFMTAQAADPTVRAVMFYSPSCGHCHIVLEEVIPPLQEKYGEQLQILLVNVTTESGQVLYGSYLEAFQISENMRGVPAMILGDHVMVGSVQIPEELPGMIEEYLADGGVDWPSIPGLDLILAELNEPESDIDTVSAEQETTQSATEVQETDSSTPGFIRKYNQDPIANSIAVVVLIGMVFSLLYAGITFIRPVDDEEAPPPPRYIWIIPVLCIAGLFVAGYLSYIEITQQEAVCGPVGDCNSVQQSKYATLFGFLPVGIFGLMGFVAILASWLVWRYGPETIRKWAALAMWGMSIFGVLFMVYLTFLEPFVIGATCAWCIGSAIITTLIMLLATGLATSVMAVVEDDE